ncbi:MAG: YceI family protein [Bacteroidia bacterium]|nr:YceI family protein [Bacteroidia bacterium]
MKKVSISLFAAMISVSSFAQSWSLDKGHSKIGFTVTHHMISEVDGYFKTFNAKLTSAKDDFSDAVFELTAETSSINSENEMRDKDLKGAGFFDVEKFTTLTFKSTSFKKVEGNKYILNGDLTIKGVSKPITMEVTIVGPQPHPRTNKPAIGVKATCTINRKDFGVGANLPELMVSNEVQLRATGEFNKD